MTTPTPPEGYRLLEPGEWMRPSVDIYYLKSSWHPVSINSGGKYHPDRYWPIARPTEAP